MATVRDYADKIKTLANEIDGAVIGRDVGEVKKLLLSLIIYSNATLHEITRAGNPYVIKNVHKKRGPKPRRKITVKKNEDNVVQDTLHDVMENLEKANELGGGDASSGNTSTHIPNRNVDGNNEVVQQNDGEHH